MQFGRVVELPAALACLRCRMVKPQNSCVGHHQGSREGCLRSVSPLHTVDGIQLLRVFKTQRLQCEQEPLIGAGLRRMRLGYGSDGYLPNHPPVPTRVVLVSSMGKSRERERLRSGEKLCATGCGDKWFVLERPISRPLLTTTQQMEANQIGSH